VKDILDLLASGSSRDEILANFPYLEVADIVAALEFASALADVLVALTRGDTVVEIT
jgi:uncharacterized protein (DUF433 family)